MIVIFPMLVSKNVNTNLVQGLAITLERYIAAYAISDFVGKSKEFNKYYNYKMKGGKIYEEYEANWFDLDPLTQNILEARGANKQNKKKRKANQKAFQSQQQTKKKPVQQQQTKTAGLEQDPTKQASGGPENQTDWGGLAMDLTKNVDKALKDLRANKDVEKSDKKPLEKPGFARADIKKESMNLEPTWVTVHTKEGIEKRLGIKVIPMMIEGFNIKHTISLDMQKYFLNTFIAGIGRKLMRIMYKIVDKWTFFGNRPRGDVRHDVFYARTGHDGQPFILLDKNEDIPKFFFAQPQNMLKLWKLSWGNLIVADDVQKMVMFCMKKYKGMCSNFSYSMIYAQTKEMAKVFEDMEDARKATSSLFRFNKKITSLGGK